MIRGLLLVICGLWLMTGEAQASSPACTSLANGANQDITVGGVCRNVSNTTGRTICVPTGNTAMWNSYIGRTATGVTITACGSPSPPAAPGDACAPGSCPGARRCCGVGGIYNLSMQCICEEACVMPPMMCP